MRLPIALVALSFALHACSGDLAVVGGRLPDAANDLGPVDVPTDGPGEVGIDVSPDTAADTAPDLPAPDALPDVPPADVAPDAPFRCAAAADCAGRVDGPVCEVASGRCVRCTLADDRCPDDQHCDGVTFACVPGCRADAGCPMGRRCDMAAHACVECVTDAHCPAGRVCSGNACVAGCNASQPCATGDTCCAAACVDTQRSVTHCGACGARCDLANATSRCAAGRCAIDACTAPFADCDRDVANGCEVDTRTSAAHCGTCGRACVAAANQTSMCAMSACVPACTAGFADCDGLPPNGCEVDTRTALTHCGACRRACAVANGTAACRAGACAVGSCTAGFADCDGSAANGCEADTRVSAAHCGMCGRSCGAGEACVAGACTVPLEVTGCARGGGGTAAGANAFRPFCSIRGRVGTLSGAVATATSTTLRIPFAGLPAGARVVRAYLYRQTYDSAGTYLSAWTLLGSNITPVTDTIGTAVGRVVQVSRVEISDLVRAAPAGADGVRAMPLTQAPNTSSGGFGWWMVYEAPSLPEHTVVIYDGMHSDVMTGNGAFTLSGFRASADPPLGDLHLFGGGDDPADAPSSARFNAGTLVTLDDVTHPAAGNFVGVQREPVDDRLAVGATTATMDFTLRNYSAVSFAILDVATGTTTSPCAPACPAGQTCESGRCFVSDGCRASMRRGFTDVMRFPRIAACGARGSWAVATAAPSAVCAAGWRPCTPDDTTAITGAAPDYLVPGSFGWVAWVDPAMSTFGNYPLARCGGVTPAVANLRGTGACTPSGVFPEGWRLAVDTDNWAWSHARTGVCAEHAIHRCAYPGGTVPQQRGHTLCCRDP